jgi:hypothetical protein
MDFDNLEHNFLLVYATPAGSFADYDDAVVDNFADVAQAAREVGLRGILFDNEEYFGPTWDEEVACPGLDLSQCREQARAVGAQVMQAMSTRWPAINMMTASGPWISEPLTYTRLEHMGYNDIAHANAVWGSFAIGMLEAAAGSAASYIDGGGIYIQRSLDDLALAYDWFRHGMARESELVPAETRDLYADEIEIAFGVYDFPDEYRGKVSDASIWRQDIADALVAADEYVWAYSERFNWTNNPHNDEKPDVPPEYLAATRDARLRARDERAAAGG